VEMIPVGVWIIMIMGLMVALHMVKVKLRRWANEDLNRDDKDFFTKENPAGYR
jgi:hypothetical protein